MRVLYILNTTVMGGGNISFINLVNELNKKNVEIFIAYPDASMDLHFYNATKDYTAKYFNVRMCAQIRSKPNKNDKAGLAKKILRLVYHSSLVRNIFLKKEIWDIKAIIKKNHIDLVHTNVGVIHCGFFAAKKSGIPHIWHIREYQTLCTDWEILPSKAQFESYLKQSYVITITEDLKKHFHIQDYPYARCIYDGCFSESDTSFSFPKQKYFLCCTRISAEKRIDEAIRAFSLFYQLEQGGTDYRMLIAGLGEPNYIEELKELSKSCKVDSVVEFLGYHDDVKPLMDHATALIVPSRFEGLGRMTAEAAFRGCLVIGHDSGGTGEILRKTGGFLYTGDHTELAGMMNQVSKLTKNEYSDRAYKAQKVAKELFSNEQSAEAVFEYYQDILRQ